MAFCSNCGHRLADDAKFCANCGASTGIIDYTKRRTVYDGELRKCPNCGEVLKSFEINCPACGLELRGRKASSAVKEFALKLEAIEARREYEKPRGLFSAFESQQRVSKTDEQKISLIKSFSVPNTKEDMLEFMILATSNMNMRAYDYANTNISKSEKEINAAWFSKVQQVYEKAKRSYSSDNTFFEIKELYDRCKSKIKKTKKKGIIKWCLLLGCMPAFFGAIFLWIRIYAPISEQNEVERLEAIVDEIEEQLENGEYKYALMNADALIYDGTIRNEEQERRWAIEREYWIDKVIEEAAANGVYLERPAEPGESTPTTEHPPTAAFKEGTYRDEPVGAYTFSVPNYWEENGSKDEYLQYYAETDGKVAILSIGYPIDEIDVVSYELLVDDNDNMIKTIESMYYNCEVSDYEEFTTNNGIKGIVYTFSFTYVEWLSQYEVSGMWFCYPSPTDNRWINVIIGATDNCNRSIDEYFGDYFIMLESIRYE